VPGAQAYLPSRPRASRSRRRVRALFADQ